MTGPIRLFVFGLGYSARAFVDGIKDRAASISGTTRSAEKAAALAARGVRPFMFDGQSAGEGVAEAVRDATHLLVSIAPGESDPVLAHHRETILAAPNLKWIGYLSTVGVYGNYGGAWVSESTTPHPTRGRSTERLAAEKAWAKLAAERGVPLATFRIAGIYGPGRNALVNLAEGKAHRVVKAGPGLQPHPCRRHRRGARRRRRPERCRHLQPRRRRARAAAGGGRLRREPHGRSAAAGSAFCGSRPLADGARRFMPTTSGSRTSDSGRNSASPFASRPTGKD